MPILPEIKLETMTTKNSEIRGDDVVERSSCSIDVALSVLVVTKNQPKSTRNAMKFMLEAIQGNGKKRGPILVKRKGGKLEVVDGNATTNAAKELGIKTLPVEIV